MGAAAQSRAGRPGRRKAENRFPDAAGCSKTQDDPVSSGRSDQAAPKRAPRLMLTNSAVFDLSLKIRSLSLRLIVFHGWRGCGPDDKFPLKAGLKKDETGFSAGSR